MPKCKNPECGKEVPEDHNFCNEECLKRFYQLQKEERDKAVIEEPEQPKDSDNILEKLSDAQYQKGVSYRQGKINIIKEALAMNYSERDIYISLIDSGLTGPKAREFISMAKEIAEHQKRKVASP